MRHQLAQLSSKCGNPQFLRLVYILLVIIATALVGAAPGAFPSTGS